MARSNRSTFSKLFTFLIPASVVGGLAIVGLQHRLAAGPTLLVLAVVPILALILTRRPIGGAVPDLVFGAVDTGLLAIPALAGAAFYGIAGAVAGSLAGDALTDGIAGFFEGGISEWLRSRGIEESRESSTTALGKMAGSLLGGGLVLSIAMLLGVSVW